MALGVVSVYDQIMDSFEEGERSKVFAAYIGALGEDPKKYRVRGWHRAGGRHAAGVTAAWVDTRTVAGRRRDAPRGGTPRSAWCARRGGGVLGALV